MKLNSRKFILPIQAQGLTDSIDADTIERHRSKLLSFMRQSRSRLTFIKEEMYTLLDAGYPNSHGFDIEGTKHPRFDEPVSSFLEKTYTLQVFGDKGYHLRLSTHVLSNQTQPYLLLNSKGFLFLWGNNGKRWGYTSLPKLKNDLDWSQESVFVAPQTDLFHALKIGHIHEPGLSLENRFQGYIDYGIQFNKLMNKMDKPSEDQKFLHNSAGLINAVNDLLSLFNHIEYLLNAGKLEEAGGILPRVNANLEALYLMCQTTKLVKVVEEGQIASALSYVIELWNKLFDFLKNIATPQAEVNHYRFLNLKTTSLETTQVKQPENTAEPEEPDGFDMV